MRSALLAARRAIPDEERRRLDAEIARRLGEWLSGQEPGVVGLWWPLAGEPDPRPGFGALIEAGWTIALPRVVGRDSPLAFGRWRPGIEMAEEAHGVRVPVPFEPVRPSLIVAPCVGFDARGWRLGYGGGYYDRTLAALGVPAAGVAYDRCEVALEPEAHDRRLQAIVTESRLLRCG